MLKFQSLELQEVILIAPEILPDERGYFVKLLTKNELEKRGIKFNFVEEFESGSKKNVIRGLHYQLYPSLEGKLIRVLKGSIFDVAVDIRKKSPDFGKWVGVNLSAENKISLWVPPGFAHGFLSLEDDTRVLYKVTAEYNPAAYKGIRWDDKDINIKWPLKEKPIVSEKDSRLPYLRGAQINFAYKEYGFVGLE